MLLLVGCLVRLTPVRSQRSVTSGGYAVVVVQWLRGAFFFWLDSPDSLVVKLVKNVTS